MILTIGSSKVGGDNPAYIVFEAGPTHTGIESAKELARHAKEAGADAIKFQIADHEKLIRQKDLPFTYKILADRESGRVETVTEPLIDIWRRRWMPESDWRELKVYCDEIGIDFFATAFSEDVVDLLVEIGVHNIKIASQDINYRDLIEYIAATGVSIQLDTGGATIGEVERAVDWSLSKGNDKIIINHCPSGYPARLESINLNVVRTLKRMFPYPIAFSDHTPGWEMDMAAVALGVDIIEKTITLDRTTRSCEHMMSLEPSEMAAFVQNVRDVEVALGNHRRVLPPEQVEAREHIRRSAHLVCDVKAGEVLKREDIEFRRPGLGIRPHEYAQHLGRRFSMDMKAESMIGTDDLE